MLNHKQNTIESNEQKESFGSALNDLNEQICGARCMGGMVKSSFFQNAARHVKLHIQNQ